VVRVASALRGVPLDSIRLNTLIAVAQVTSELDDVHFPLHRTSLQERARWQSVIQQQRLPPSVVRALHATDDRAVTARAKRLASALMWVQGQELDAIEKSLLQHLRDDNAAGPIRSVADRTRDLLGVVARVAEILTPSTPATVEALSSVVDSGVLQLELGVPGPLVWLAKDLKRLLARGDYLALARRDLTSPEAIRSTDVSVMLKLLRDEDRVNAVVAAAKRMHSGQPTTSGDHLAMPAPPTD
jgi:helicase